MEGEEEDEEEEEEEGEEEEEEEENEKWSMAPKQPMPVWLGGEDGQKAWWLMTHWELWSCVI